MRVARRHPVARKTPISPSERTRNTWMMPPRASATVAGVPRFHARSNAGSTGPGRSSLSVLATNRKEPDHGRRRKKLGEFMGRFVGDLGAVLHAPLIVLGDKLGLYRELAKGPATAAELASRTGTVERYVAEWLAANAASGYVEYDATAREVPHVRRAGVCPRRSDSPAYIPGAFLIAMSMFKDEHKVTEIFRTGKGLGWHEHDKCLFEGTEKFFRPSYAANLVELVDPRPRGRQGEARGRRAVADVGCGHGASTILMAKAFPRPRSTRTTTTRSRSRSPSARRRRRGSAIASPSRSRRRRRSPARATIWSPSSIACTTWAIPRARRATSSRRSLPRARG
jgi:hypothetical protein